MSGFLYFLFTNWMHGMAHKKKNVRKKECPVCEREFSWTKKLDKNWESMVYCSDQCRRVKKYEGVEHQK